VTLSTVHRVKGMEWDKVAVFGASAGILPHRLAEDIEEERRVFHVALTRCRQHVVVLADEARPSPFLAELAGVAPHRVAVTNGGPVTAGGLVTTARRARGPGGPGGPSRPALPQGPGADPALEQALRSWRTDRSRRDKVSPFIVLHDRTLLAIAASRPASLIDLRGIDGIGPTKLDLYGDEILSVLAEADQPA
jgi:DNA helicase-2/ATP-dependent DNA helicase PcrA